MRPFAHVDDKGRLQLPHFKSLHDHFLGNPWVLHGFSILDVSLLKGTSAKHLPAPKKVLESTSDSCSSTDLRAARQHRCHTIGAYGRLMAQREVLKLEHHPDPQSAADCCHMLSQILRYPGLHRWDSEERVQRLRESKTSGAAGCRPLP